MVPPWGYQVTLSMLLLSLFLNSSVCLDEEVKGSMYGWLCEGKGDKIHWLSEKKYALITGKSTEDSRKQCTIIFGLATRNTEARFKINIDFMFFHDCEVRLQINQSKTSGFTADSSKEMFLSGCYSGYQETLYAQPHYYVLISLSKKYDYLEAYNFRLNISVAEELPPSGPALHVVIIVAFVCVVLVVTAAVLLLKYVIRLSYRWSEERREQAMTRAINLYNSSEPLEEPELAYVHPGAGSGSSSSGSGGQRSNRGKPQGAEIAFVHSDGRIERFRPLGEQRSEELVTAVPISRPKPQKCRVRTEPTDSQQKSQRSRPGNTPMTAEESEEPVRFPICYPPLALSHKESRNLHDQAETASLGGLDLPPSYEEALDMPPPEGEGGNFSVQGDFVMGEGMDDLVGAVGGVNYGDNGGNTGQRVQGDNDDAEKNRKALKGVRDLQDFGPESPNYMNIGGRLELLDQDTEEDEVNEQKGGASEKPLLSPSSPK